jgi:hypothetical protein
MGAWHVYRIIGAGSVVKKYVSGAVTGLTPSAFAGNIAAGLTSSFIRTAAGGRINGQSILADAFGNAIGESIVSADRNFKRPVRSKSAPHRLA